MYLLNANAGMNYLIIRFSKQS